MAKNGNIKLKKNKGSSLILVIAIVGVLFILCSALGTSVVWEANNARNQEKKTQAYYIARAGAAAVTKWLSNMNDTEEAQFNSLMFPLNSNNNIFANGTYDITITKQSQQLSVKSIGKVKNGTSYVTDIVTTVLNKVDSNTVTSFKTAIFGDSSVTIGSTVKGDTGTNSSQPGAINIISGFKITGSIYIPQNGNPNVIVTQPENSGVRPNIKLSSAVMNYPSPVFPVYPSNLGIIPNINLSGGEPKNGPIYSINGDTYYDTITISANRILKINTNGVDTVIRVKNLDVQQGRIIISGSGNVKLYVDNCINLRGTVNTEGTINDPKQLIFYCNNGTSFNIANGVKFNGSLYIGNADIYISGGAIISGDIVTTSNSFIMEGGANVLSGVIYAPNANIKLDRGANINGAVIGDVVNLTNGGGKVILTGTTIDPLFPIETSTVNGDKYKSYWK